MTITSKEIVFNSLSGTKLSARLDSPIGKIRAYALFAHCFTCNKNFPAVSRISTALSDMGIAVLRFDFTGLGGSEGEFSNTNFSSNVQDLIKAADYMRENLEAPSILIGHSLGGTAVISAAKNIKESKAVATIGSPSDASHITKHFGNKEAEIMENGIAKVSIAGRNFNIKKQLLEDVNSHNIEEDIKNLNKALLILHSPIDNIVGIENAAKIFIAAKHPKSFITLDDADHLLSERQDAKYAAQVIAAWANRYISKYENYEYVDEKDQENSEGVIISSVSQGQYTQKVQVGKHTLFADEPVEQDGNNEGPNPYEFLQVALGACKAITLIMYANRKKIPLEGLKVYMSYDRIHAEDCQECEDDDNAKIDELECEIDFQGEELTEQQKTKLIEIADKCPVHKTLTSETIIKTKLKE